MAPHSSTLAWKIPWMEEPGRLQSMRSLRVGHDWATSLSLFTLCIGEGNGSPLQCSCLENPRDGGAWWGAVSGVAQSLTRLKRLSSSSSSILSLTGSYCFSWVMGYLWVTNPIFIDRLFLLFDLSFFFFFFFKSNIYFCVLLLSGHHYSIKSKVKAKLLHRRSQLWWLVIFLSKHLTWLPWNTEAGIKKEAGKLGFRSPVIYPGFFCLFIGLAWSWWLWIH